MTGIATLLSVLSIPIILRLFSEFIPEGLTADFMFQPGYALLLLLLVAVVSFLAGCYPAFILSRFPPTSVLRNQVSGLSGQPRNAGIRNLLTISPFPIAQFFILAPFMVCLQNNHSLYRNRSV